MTRISLALSLCLVAAVSCDKSHPVTNTPAPVAAPVVAAVPAATVVGEVTIPTGAPGEPAAIPNGTKMKCPVSGDEFTVNAKSMQVIYKGKRTAFCCADCYPDFKKDPAKYPLGA